MLAFSWGYYGWGPYTDKLVELADTVEAARGFKPPVFADVRLRRVVRAPGFRERAFEQLLGPERYHWLPDLGNRQIGDDSIDDMELRDPAAANTLLDLIIDSATSNRRVIFFCSCESPTKRHECHRGLVATTLLAAAKKRKTSLAIQEWPGGSPGIVEVTVSLAEMRKLQVLSRSDSWETMRLRVPDELALSDAMALPHFSILKCHYEDKAVVAVAGPALFAKDSWFLPVHAAYSLDVLKGNLRKTLDADLKEFELVPYGARLDLPPRWRTLT